MASDSNLCDFSKVVRVVMYDNRLCGDPVNSVYIRANTYIEIVDEFISRGYRSGILVDDEMKEIDDYNREIREKDLNIKFYDGIETAEGIMVEILDKERKVTGGRRIPFCLNMQGIDVFLYLQTMHNLSPRMKIFIHCSDPSLEDQEDPIEKMTILKKCEKIRSKMSPSVYERNISMADQTRDIRLFVSMFE